MGFGVDVTRGWMIKLPIADTTGNSLAFSAKRFDLKGSVSIVIGDTSSLRNKIRTKLV